MQIPIWIAPSLFALVLLMPVRIDNYPQPEKGDSTGRLQLKTDIRNTGF